jgi:hypothetical protein
MKKLILLAGLYCLQPALHAAPLSTSSKTSIAPTSANERAKAHFRENYVDVPNAAWYSAPDNSIYCTFQLGTTVERVFYDQQGYWQFTLISYPPTRLKENLKKLVSEHFDGYHISYINEVRSNYDEPVYMINIENADNIKVIKVFGDEIEVKQDLKKVI